MLLVRDLVVRYGMATALDGVNLMVRTGEMVALVGPNGAGKSTLVNAATGMVRIASGSVEADGKVVQVPEGRQMFPEMSVEDNLRLGAWGTHNRNLEPIHDLFPDLHRLRKQPAGTLSGGQQQMVAIGRALMAKPDMLVVDELSLGLAPIIVHNLAEHLTALNKEQGTSILLIEQEVDLAFSICSRAYLLEAGRVVLEGTTSDLALDPRVRLAYLGGKFENDENLEAQWKP